MTTMMCDSNSHNHDQQLQQQQQGAMEIDTAAVAANDNHDSDSHQSRENPIEDSTNSRSGVVRFDEIRIREYNLIPCDNPFCSSGCPIGMGWRIQRETSIKLDTYEQHRPPRRGHLVIPADVRQDMLMRQWEVPFSAIRQTIQETTIERELRKKSQLRLQRKGIARKIKGGSSKLMKKVFGCVVVIPAAVKKMKEARDLEAGRAKVVSRVPPFYEGDALDESGSTTSENTINAVAGLTLDDLDLDSNGDGNNVSVLDKSCRRPLILLLNDDNEQTATAAGQVETPFGALLKSKYQRRDSRGSNENRLSTAHTSLLTELEESQKESLIVEESESSDFQIAGSHQDDEEKDDHEDDEDDSTLETDDNETDHEEEDDFNRLFGKEFDGTSISMTSSKDPTDNIPESESLEGLDVTQRRTNSIGIMLAA